MTITYTAEVATSSLGCFLKLLLRWRGSIYKLLWKDFLIFVVAFYALSFMYRFALNEAQRVVFESVSIYCDSFNNLIPVAFVLGFYVSIVVTRWWDQFNTIPWPDRTAMFVTALIHGHDERGRLMRRTIMRYLCLSYTLTLAAISPPVKKRFPTIDHITESGIMLPNEQLIFEGIKTPHSKYFVPLVWAASLITRARKEGRIKDDIAVKTLVDEINAFRGSLGMLFNYDWMSVPLVYTQVVTLSVYTFFLSCLMGRQFIQPKDSPANPSSTNGDFYVPVFTLLQFLFYMGWLKVAETLVNPFGEDDDDFEINWVIDRNLQVSYLVVDEMHSDFPELIRDAYWDDVDFQLPYTVATEPYRVQPHLGSAVDINIDAKESEFVPLESIREEDHGFCQDADKEMDDGLEIKKSNPMLNSVICKDGVATGSPGVRSILQNVFKRSASRNSHRRSQLSVAVETGEAGDRADDAEMFQMSDLSGVEEDEPVEWTREQKRTESRRHLMYRRQRDSTDVDQSVPLTEPCPRPHRTSESTVGPTSPTTTVSESCDYPRSLSRQSTLTESHTEREPIKRGVMEPEFVEPVRCGFMEPPLVEPIRGGVMEPPLVEPIKGGVMEPPLVEPIKCGVMEPPLVEPIRGGVTEPPLMEPIRGGGMEPKLVEPPKCGVMEPPLVEPPKCGVMEPPLVEPPKCGVMEPPLVEAIRGDVVEPVLCRSSPTKTSGFVIADSGTTVVDEVNSPPSDSPPSNSPPSGDPCNTEGSPQV